MTAEILCVGTEILLGNILNTNTKFLAEKCAEWGLSLFYQGVVGDNEERLLKAVTDALSRSDVLITSGGLGPTKDDITKETICRVLGLEMEMDEDSKQAIINYFTKSGRSFPESNYKQAMMPVGGKALQNKYGTAPAVMIETNNTSAKDKFPDKVIFCLPGPPRELNPLVEEYLTPYFISKSGSTLKSVMIKLTGIGEGSAAEVIGDLIENSSNPTVAPYAKTNEVHFRVTAKAENEKEADLLLEPVVDEINKKLGRFIYSTDENEDLEDVIIKNAALKGLKIATCESCTGGLLAGRIINVSGASDAFVRGYVTYANEAKIEDVHVSPETLNTYGAVSEQCAIEMANGAMLNAGADIAVSTTGVAGPSGGSDEKPVGCVYIGIAAGNKSYAKKFVFNGNRQRVRGSAVQAALTMLWRELQ